MRQIIFVFTFGLLCCFTQIAHSENFARTNSPLEEQSLFEKTENAQIDVPPDTIYNEYYLIPNDTLFKHLELGFIEITAEEFGNYETAYKISCPIDSGGFISGYDLTITERCHEICQTYVVDNTSGKMILLPSDYDQGILGLIFSPTCNQFIIYSCYDLPSYSDYYQERSEIIGFQIVNGKGLEVIKPAFKYYSKDWSISDIVWIDDKTIALKVYEGERPSTGNSYQYKYYKTVLNK